ncbi:glycosyl hydrolase family 18 protein [Tichowtungia aerotolerans]|uniref:chitinase n=1 Tax=Tichowtungia aerotolerans TaxID=2697043 RepID=A0A6P1M7U3_9BACT|nr:glycosyl hydrolase family 18 protein [Tichowtungia aerotolerans]QHI70660.1 hypothetical protein GT409_14825 [Tichowtungia aerotolerans]
MKDKIWSKILVVVVLLHASLQAQLIDFQMNEGTGTSLNGLSQTGSDSAVFGAVRPAVTDGAGNLVFSNTLSSAAGLPLSQVYSNNGLYRIEMRFDSWNMSAAPNLANVNWLVQQTGDANVLNLTFRRHDSYGGMLFTVFGGTDGGQNTSTPLDATIPLISAGIGIVVRVDVDIEAGLYDFYWKWDGDTSFTAAGAARSLGGLPGIDKFVLSSNGSSGWGTGQFISMDYYTVTYIEPSPYFIEYTMNDREGTVVENLENTGNDHLSYNSGIDEDAVTDGEGSLHLENVSHSQWMTHTPLAAITNGVVIIEWRIDSWDLSAATASNAVVSVGLSGDSEDILNCQFMAASGGISIGSYATDGRAAGSTFIPFSNSETGVVIRVVLDLDARFYSSYWKYDTDSEFSRIVRGNAADVSKFTELVLCKLKGNSASWGLNQFVDIDYINVTLTNGASFGPPVTDYYGKHIVGYIPYYRNVERLIDYSQVTDVNYGHMMLSSAGDLDTSLVQFSRLSNLVENAHAANVNVLISCSDKKSGNFSSMASSVSGRTNFVSQIKQFCLDNNLDGVDIDWEYPYTSTDKVNYGELLELLDMSLSEDELLLTSAVSFGWMQDIPLAALQHLDWVNIMAYDMGLPDHSTFDDALSALANWESFGFPRNKVCLGVPFYGANTNGDLQAYFSLYDDQNPTPDVDVVNGYYFNGINTVRRKAMHVLKKGYLGVMIWDLGGDKLNDSASLLTSIADTLSLSPPQVINFQMSETRGTSLNGLDQTGSDSATFGVARASIITDGDGNLIFTNMAAGSLATGLILDQSYTGQYRAEIRFDSWDMSSAPDMSSVDWLMQQTGDANVLYLKFRRMDSFDGMAFSVIAEGGQSTSTPDISGGAIPLVSTEGLTVRVDFDTVVGLYDVYWKFDSDVAFTAAGTNRKLTLPCMNKMIVTGTGEGASWGGGQFVAIDSYSVTYIEPLLDFQMSETRETSLSGLDQTGSDSATFGVARAGIITDGDGNLIFTNMAAGSLATGLILDQSYAGQYRAEIRFDSWDMSSAPDMSSVDWLMQQTGDANVLYLKFRRMDSFDGMAFSVIAEGGQSTSTPDISGGAIPLVSTEGLTVRVDFDTVVGLYDVYWKFDSDVGFNTAGVSRILTLPSINKMILTGVGDGAAWGSGQYISMDYYTVTCIENMMGVVGETVCAESMDQFNPLDFYNRWVADYLGLSDRVGLLDDPDGDCLDNLSEYALGGDPGNNEDIGIAGDVALTTDSGTNYFEYTYRKRRDAVARGLSYYLEKNLDLVSGLWTNLDYEVMGVTSIDDNFDIITNSIPVNVDSEKLFIRLRIEGFGF